MADNEGKKEVKGFRFSNLKTNDDKENNGVWVDYASGFKIKIARMGSRRFKEFMAKAGKPHLRKIQRGNLDNDVADTMMKKAIARTILLDWEGLLDDDNQPIPFSEENALKCLEESYDFYSEVLQLCQERELFQDEEKEAAGKN